VGSLVAAGVLLAAFLVGEVVQRRPMLDVSLFRKPTFDGGLVAAFAMSGSMFSLLTFVIIYLQSVLGYDALGAGLRTLFITLAVFVTAAAAGRLTTVVPVRAMISAGFVLVGTGLLLMRGLTPESEWTHLIPGMIVSGVGAGLVNVPLASTAVGVVEPARGGMASGINATLRQMGLATGIAVYGSLFAAHLRDDGFTGALNFILLIGVVVALAAAVVSAVLIRAKDFVTEQVPAPTQEEVLA
jgi:predicted MFS family arabinose efflux permease